MPATESAAGQTRGRARAGGNAATRAATNEAQLLHRMPKREFTDVEADVTHCADFEAGIQQFQTTKHVAILTLTVPIAYSHDIISIQQTGMPTLFFRVFVPPIAPSLVLDVEEEVDMAEKVYSRG